MVKKAIDIEIPKDNPFTYDLLRRKEEVEVISSMIESITQPFVLSIEAKWGNGKTTFIKMLQAYLEKNHYHCLYFNAWENDYSDDPLITFLSEINTLLNNSEENDHNQTLKISLQKVQKAGVNILKYFLPLFVNIATQGLINQINLNSTIENLPEITLNLEKSISQIAEARIRAFEQQKNDIDYFKKVLIEFADNLSQDADDGKHRPVIIFIDELDRCKPTYAVALLERIKHLFNINNFIFVLSIDRNQIEQSIRGIYGTEMDSDGYLRRFIDFAYPLATTNNNNFCNNLLQYFQLKHDFPFDDDQTIFHIFYNLSTFFGFSLRKIEQCLSEIAIILRNRKIIGINLLTFLITIKNDNPLLYHKLKVTKGIDIVNEIINYLPTPDDVIFNNNNVFYSQLQHFHVYLILARYSPEEINQLISNINLSTKDKNIQQLLISIKEKQPNSNDFIDNIISIIQLKIM